MTVTVLLGWLMYPREPGKFQRYEEREEGIAVVGLVVIVEVVNVFVVV